MGIEKDFSRCNEKEGCPRYCGDCFSRCRPEDEKCFEECISVCPEKALSKTDDQSEGVEAGKVAIPGAFKEGFDPRRCIDGHKNNTLKNFQKEEFENMTPEEKREYLKDIDKFNRWRMAEGNPKQDTEMEHKGEINILGIKYVQPGNGDNIEANTKTTPSLPSVE